MNFNDKINYNAISFNSKCLFCNKKCRTIIGNAWNKFDIKCNSCQIIYSCDYINLKTIFLMFLTNDFTFEINFLLNKSFIYDRQSSITLTLEYIVKDITPLNVNEKIKTYLLFS